MRASLREIKPTSAYRLAFLLLLIVFVALASLSVKAAEQPRNPSAHFFEQSFGDYQDELQSAVKSGKKGVLIMFVQDDCPFCEKMKATVLNQPTVQDFYRKNFKIFEVDIYASQAVKDFAGREMPQRQFALAHRARLTPTFVFVGPDGKEMARFTGFADQQTFMLLGQFVASGAYKTDNFINYKRNRAQSS